MSNNTREYYVNRREDWGTAKDLFDKLNAIFGFGIDLAARADNAKCSKWIGETDGDGRDVLSASLHDLVVSKGVNPSREWAWCNPPYGSNGCGKVMEAIMTLPRSVSLIPAPVGAKWFYKQVWQKADYILFFHGRLRFEGAPNVAMFDSCLAIKGHLTWEQREELVKVGTIVNLTEVDPWTE